MSAIDLDIQDLLEKKYLEYATPAFVENDPIRVPRSFTSKEDIEISAFLTASIAWGNRLAICKSAVNLMNRMGNEPYRFVQEASDQDIAGLAAFRHRTFGDDDLVWFIHSLRHIYRNHGGLEPVFAKGFGEGSSVFSALVRFRQVFLETEGPARSRKHVADVIRGSAAKRLNLMVMWLTRPTGEGVHMGLWKSIPPSQLMIPLDVHLGRVSRKLGLLTRKTDDWRAVEELTASLRVFDASDPVRFDFALFGLGLFDKF